MSESEIRFSNIQSWLRLGYEIISGGHTYCLSDEGHLLQKMYKMEYDSDNGSWASSSTVWIDIDLRGNFLG